jgi:DNA-binding XRE family transcriptional regulator
MPYISEQIKIVDTAFDRRVKLTPDDKVLIAQIREEEGTSYQKLANQFKVSKRTIIFICKPETQEASYAARVARGGSKIYYNKEAHTETMREHRRYKQELFLKGEIKLKKEDE